LSALALERVTVELGGRPVVDGVSLAVDSGEWVTLIGPNGAGKTTLLRAVAGLVGHEGRIALDNRELRSLGRREVARRVAVVPQVPLMPAGMTVRDYVLLGRTPYVSYMGRESRRDVSGPCSRARSRRKRP
jgi:iron complex transport system ATP-binding protein